MQSEVHPWPPAQCFWSHRSLLDEPQLVPCTSCPEAHRRYVLKDEYRPNAFDSLHEVFPGGKVTDAHAAQVLAHGGEQRGEIL